MYISNIHFDTGTINWFINIFCYIQSLLTKQLEYIIQITAMSETVKEVFSKIYAH